MSLRVAYTAPLQPNWVAAIDLLANREAWQPVYLIAHQRHTELESAYPDAIVHDRNDAMRGIPPEQFAGRELEPLDGVVLDALLDQLHMFMGVCDRADNRETFTYRQRLETLYRLGAYWLSALRETAPDLVVMHESPHVPHESVIYVLCDVLGISRLMPFHTHIPMRTFARSAINEVPLAVRQALEAPAASVREMPSLPDHVAEYLREVASQDEELWYIGAQRERARREEQGLLGKIRRGLTSPGRTSAYARSAYAQFREYATNSGPVPFRSLKSANGSFEEGPLPYREWLSYRRWAARQIRQLGEDYHRVSKNVDLSKPYVYFPLHYQPERTTMPEGGAFEDQRLAIRMISAAMPAGWSVYVKEHPSQLAGDPRMEAEKGRSSRYYRDLAAIRDVQLVDMAVGSHELIDASKAVATITGTAGWEALVRGKPVFVFGDAWYRWMHGAFDTRTNHDLKLALELAETGFSFSDERLSADIAIAVSTSHVVPGYGQGTQDATDGAAIADMLKREYARYYAL